MMTRGIVTALVMVLTMTVLVTGTPGKIVTTDSCVESCQNTSDAGFHNSCERCNGFIVCSNGVKYDFNCSGTTHWDNGITTCVAEGNSATCTEVTDECYSTPCMNGASCTDGDQSYTCACVEGYSGTHCETDIDDCRSSPCVNGATCIDAIDSYTCSCVAGYTGSNCETEINECESNPCQSGAICEDAFLSYTCHCPEGKTGVHCESECNGSEGSQCVHSCEGLGDGDYQSCNGCHVFVTCSNGYTYDDRPCPAGEYWDAVGDDKCSEGTTTCFMCD